MHGIVASALGCSGRRLKGASETTEYAPMGAGETGVGLHIKYGDRVDGPYPEEQLREALPELPPGVQVWVGGGWVDLAVGLHELSDRRSPPQVQPVPLKAGSTGGRWAKSLVALVLVVGTIQTFSGSDDEAPSVPSANPPSGEGMVQPLTYEETLDALRQTFVAGDQPCADYATVGDQSAYETMEIPINAGGYSMNHAAFTIYFAGNC